MADITGQLMLDRNRYTATQCPIASVEYFIDDSCDYINLMAGQSMGNMTGITPNKTITITDNQAAVVRPLVSLLMKAYVDRGPNVTAGLISVATILQDPQYAINREMLNKSMNVLRGRSFERV